MAPVAWCLSDRFQVLEPLQRTSGVVQGPVRLVGFSWGAMLALTEAKDRFYELLTACLG